MELWQIREKHYIDTDALCIRFKFYDAMRNWMKFDGKLFWPAFNEMGHTSLELERCKCYEDWRYGIQDWRKEK